MLDYQVCPCCGAACYRDEVDIGVGVQYGPWFCIECGWDESHALDKEYPGSLQNPRNPDSDKRPLWKDGGVK